MRYQKARWLHDLEDEPVVLYSESDDDGTEVRKVEAYRDGRMDLADAVTRTGSTRLSETKMPTLGEINAQEEFVAEAITANEFETVWKRAWEWFADPS